VKCTPIDIELMSEYIEIDESIPETLRWKKRPSNRVKIGDPVGNKAYRKNTLYYEFSLKSVSYLNHRIYWALKNKEDPGNVELDHADRKNGDFSNIRKASRSLNSANCPPRNGKGYKGFYKDKRDGRYYARIRVKYKYISLGNFASEEEAARAYDKAAKEYFGEFAWLNFPDDHSTNTSPVANTSSQSMRLTAFS